MLVEKTWSEALSEELQKPYAKLLCEFVEREICSGGLHIYPPQHLLFNALNSTPFDRDPYDGPGQAQATGLSFSVPEGVKIPSSLLNIFKELHQHLGYSIPFQGNLERWAVQDPYHEPGQAMGLSFSVLKGVEIPSGRLNISKELH